MADKKVILINPNEKDPKKKEVEVSKEVATILVKQHGFKTK